MPDLAMIMFVGILLASLAVWVMVLERLVSSISLIPLAVPTTRPRPMLAIILVFTSVFLSCSSLFLPKQSSPAIDDLVKVLDNTLFVMATQVMTCCVLLVCLTRLGSQRLTRFGIDGRHPTRDIGIGLLGYFAAAIPVFLFNFAMEPFRTLDNQHFFLRILRGESSVPLAVLVIVSALVLAPLSEELIYRVIFQGTLQRHVTPTASIVISATVFSAVHGFPDAIGLFPLAMILGFLYWRTGSYLTVVTTHAVFNGVSVLLTILSLEG